MKAIRVAFSLLFAVVIVSGQQDAGSIAGTVTDSSGSAVPNTAVAIHSTDRNLLIRTVSTDGDGNYSAPQLPVGRYSVTATSKGFKAAFAKMSF